MRSSAPLLPTEVDSFLPVAHVALMLHVSSRTVRRWIRQGRLGAVRTSKVRGRFRVPRARLESFLEGASTEERDARGSPGSTSSS